MENEWRDAIEKALMRDLNTLKVQANVSHGALNIYPYLVVLDVSAFSQIFLFHISYCYLFFTTIKF